MTDFNWRSLVATVAPVLGTALGGPLGAIAGKVVGQVLLGKDDATQDEIATAVLGATPEQLLMLKTADIKFKTDMATLGVDLERIASEDRQSARRREVEAHDSWTPRGLGVLVVIAWCVIQYSLMTHVIDPSMRELVARVLGTLDSALMCVLYYYFGSSSSSAAKNTIISQKNDSQ